MTSRMVLGVHYFSDVCAGACVGLIMTSILLISGMFFTFVFEKDNVQLMGEDYLRN